LAFEQHDPNIVEVFGHIPKILALKQDFSIAKKIVAKGQRIQMLVKKENDE
jgi:hypothetical protein